MFKKFRSKTFYRFLLAILLVCFAARMVSIFKTHRFVSLTEGCADHITHIYSGIAFWDNGFDVYKIKTQKLLNLYSGPDRDELIESMSWNPNEVFARTNHPETPLFIGWGMNPRSSPFGNYILHAPASIAVLYKIADPKTIYALMIFIYFIFTILAGIEISKQIFFINQKQGRFLFLTKLVIVFFLIVQLIHWSLEGFYDPVAIYLLIKSVRHYVDRKWDKSLLFFGLSWIIHFRTLWYLPLAIACIWQQSKEIQTRKQIFRSALGLFLASLAFANFVYFKWHLDGWFTNNYFYMLDKHWPLQLSKGHYIIFLSSFLAVSIEAYRRQFLPVSLLLMMTILWMLIPHMCPWHSLFMMPLVLLLFRKGQIFDLCLGFVFYGVIAKTLFLNWYILDFSTVRRLFTFLF